MVCERCGGKTIYDTQKLIDEHEKLVQEIMDEYKDLSCEKLIEEVVSSPMSFRHEAAKRLLIERGHEDT